ncbi:MAG: hypothetical protein U1D35_03035 [Paracoccaceae bacterium]|nr:hypothetical protein [Paracoccaceae bacterium]
MLNHLFNFMKAEDGAVTVDWVVLTAAIVGMTLLMMSQLVNETWNIGVVIADGVATQP